MKYFWGLLTSAEVWEIYGVFLALAVTITAASR